jgi:hypothetical protein
MLRVIILKKARLFVHRRVEIPRREVKKKSANHFLRRKSNEKWVHCIEQSIEQNRMKIALEENIHATYIHIYRTINKMCSLLIEVLLFTISSIYIHFSLL